MRTIKTYFKRAPFYNAFIRTTRPLFRFRAQFGEPSFSYAVQALLRGKPFYLKVFEQKLAVRCLFVLAIFIDEPDAIQTILTTVIADPKSATNVFAPSGGVSNCLHESY
jgi:hypothetical protein